MKTITATTAITGALAAGVLATTGISAFGDTTPADHTAPEPLVPVTSAPLLAALVTPNALLAGSGAPPAVTIGPTGSVVLGGAPSGAAGSRWRDHPGDIGGLLGAAVAVFIGNGDEPGENGGLLVGNGADGGRGGEGGSPGGQPGQDG